MFSKILALGFSQRITGFLILPVLVAIYIYYIDTIYFLNESFFTAACNNLGSVVFEFSYMACIIVLFYHGSKGVGDVLKDYVHHPVIQSVALNVFYVLVFSLVLSTAFNFIN